MGVQQHKVNTSLENQRPKGGSFDPQLKTGTAGINDFDTCSILGKLASSSLMHQISWYQKTSDIHRM